MKSKATAIISVFCAGLLLLGAGAAEAQKKGQSAKIQHGVVVGMDPVDLTDSKATQGAVLGGAIAYGSSSGKSGYKKRRNAAIGALVGAAAGSAAGTRQMGMLYTVAIAGGAIKVVTDQTEIHMNDCVVVEETSQGANIRRVDAEVCYPENAAVVDALQEEFQEEAAECAAAKAEVAAATTDEALDLALRKMSILCNG